MKWTPITRSKPDPKGVNSRYPGLLNVEVNLSRTPPSEWAEFFSQPFAVPMKLSMHPPTLSGSIVELMLPDDEFDAYIESLDARIAAANESFERHVLPEVEAAEARENERHRAEAKRMAEARRRADTL